MQPRVPEDVKAELASQGLTLWHCQHPLTFNYEYTGNGPKRGRADKTRVHVQLAGPGIKTNPWGFGSNVREAVADALRNAAFRAERPGLDGALARLEMALRALEITVVCSRLERGEARVDEHGNVLYFVYSGLDDDDVPF